jgi:hypothetical protein
VRMGVCKNCGDTVHNAYGLKPSIGHGARIA